MIISFSGRIGSGKDLSGNICKILLQSPHLNNSEVETFLNKGLYENEGQWKIRKWADKLKDIVCLILNCSREQLEDRAFKEKELGPDWEIPLQEEWKAITGYEGLYEISNFGRVKSLNRLDSMGRVVEETIRAQHIGTTGYPTITLNKDGKKKTKVVHQLVAESFLGHIPDSYNGGINHIDNIKTNNRLDNLEVVSSRYNTQYSKSTEGVYERRNKFEVYIRIDGKKTYLGSYTSKEEALKVRNKKLQEVDTFIPLKYVAKQWTPRLLLQNMGTQIGREIIHPDIWVNSLMSEYKPMIQSTKEEDKRLLSIWKNMNTRCKNPNYEKYHKYGGKGITICKEWEDFQKFRFWALSNGYTNELTLDRINVNGNYEPSNCRFVTSSLQAFNKGSYHQGTSDLKGINKYSAGRWQAQIQSKGIKKNLGYYQTEEEARKVYQKEYDRINKELEEESFNLQRKCVYPNFIITDTRFENELKTVKDRKGLTIRVIRDLNLRTEGKEAKKVEAQTIHSSESALDNEVFDYEIVNDGTISDLIDKIRIILIENNLINVN